MSLPPPKTLQVVAAFIFDRTGPVAKVLTTARGAGAWAGWWEFPGGKIEPGEKPKDALMREIREELNVAVAVGDLIDTIEYDYPDFHLSMACYLADITGGVLTLNEHAQMKWLTADTLDTVRWLPADALLLQKIKALLTGGKEEQTLVQADEKRTLR